MSSNAVVEIQPSFAWQYLQIAIDELLAEVPVEPDTSGNANPYFPQEREQLERLQAIIRRQDAEGLREFIISKDPLLLMFKENPNSCRLLGSDMIEKFNAYQDEVMKLLEGGLNKDFIKQRLQNLARYEEACRPLEGKDLRGDPTTEECNSKRPLIAALQKSIRFRLFPSLRNKVLNAVVTPQLGENKDSIAMIYGLATASTIMAYDLRKKPSKFNIIANIQRAMIETGKSLNERWKIDPQTNRFIKFIFWALNVHKETAFSPVDMLIVGGETKFFKKMTFGDYFAAPNEPRKSKSILEVLGITTAIFFKQAIFRTVALLVAVVVHAAWLLYSIPAAFPAIYYQIYVASNARTANTRGLDLRPAQRKAADWTRDAVLPWVSLLPALGNVVVNIYKFFVPFISLPFAMSQARYRWGQGYYKELPNNVADFRYEHIKYKYPTIDAMPQDPLLRLYVELHENNKFASLPQDIQDKFRSYAFAAAKYYTGFKAATVLHASHVLLAAPELETLILSVSAGLKSPGLDAAANALCVQINDVAALKVAPPSRSTTATAASTPALSQAPSPAQPEPVYPLVDPAHAAFEPVLFIEAIKLRAKFDSTARALNFDELQQISQQFVTDGLRLENVPKTTVVFSAISREKLNISKNGKVIATITQHEISEAGRSKTQLLLDMQNTPVADREKVMQLFVTLVEEMRGKAVAVATTLEFLGTSDYPATASSLAVSLHGYLTDEANNEKFRPGLTLRPVTVPSVTPSPEPGKPAGGGSSIAPI